ncbi:putative protein disulfide-isomerase [Rosa chinensis]|uniref:Thioredoxin domain-containing protein n=1 Tax=Rosa chinensis TaxID=74649 RepID=A0A2P6QNT1_ROSCH|nr:putative protein disulfide-isomerase [Rosa chinensis]
MASRFVLVFTLSALLLLSSRPALSKDAVVDDDDEDLSFLKEPTEQQGHSHDAALHYPDSDEFDGESYDDADDFSDFDEGDQEAYKEPEDFVILKGANFSKTIKKNRFVLVELYAPWCGHCQAFGDVHNQVDHRGDVTPLVVVP